MLFQKTQISFNEPDYITVHYVMNTMKANVIKIAQNKPQ